MPPRPVATPAQSSQPWHPRHAETAGEESETSELKSGRTEGEAPRALPQLGSRTTNEYSSPERFTATACPPTAYGVGVVHGVWS